MRVRACIVKTAQFKASAEEGKYSEAYKREATLLLVHPEDMAAWGFKEGIHVSCKNLENGQAAVLVVKATRNARKGMVNIILSPWTACLVKDDGRFIDVLLEPSGVSASHLEQLLTSKRPGVP
jgi:formylmethanofuran dehydrogenase subunit D